MHEPYIERGTGHAIVFSHGTLMDATQFLPQLGHLENKYRCVSYNSRVLTRNPSSHGLRDLVKDCHDLLDIVGIERCVLTGMSVGGYMALEFALTYPERLEGLILIDSMSQGYTQAEQDAYGQAFAKLAVDGMVPKEFAEWAALYCFGPTTRACNPDLVKYWVDRWSDTVPARAVFYQAYSWIWKNDITAWLGEIAVPTLLVHGEEDLPVPIDRTRTMLNALPNGTLARIPRAGHTSNLENPEAVNQAIASFLLRVL